MGLKRVYSSRFRETGRGRAFRDEFSSVKTPRAPYSARLLPFAPPSLRGCPRRGETGTVHSNRQLNPPTELLILVSTICISRKSNIYVFSLVFALSLASCSLYVCCYLPDDFLLTFVWTESCYLLRGFPVMRKVSRALRAEPGHAENGSPV